MTTDGGPIHHCVFFALALSPGSSGERAFFERLDALADIPGVEAFRRVREVHPTNAYQHGVLMRFADAAAYAAYNEHPEHVRFVEEFWGAAVREFQEIDFVG